MSSCWIGNGLRDVHMPQFLSTRDTSVVQTNNNSKSTITFLSGCMKFAANAFESLEQVGTVYMNFSKAFERVDHEILLSNLQRKALEILQSSSIIFSKKQDVETGGYYSLIFINPQKLRASS